MPSCLVIQHLEVEGPYAIGDMLARRGVDLVVRRTFANEVVPSAIDEFDAVVVMGGPMSARSDSGFPTRRTEISLLGDAVAKDVPVLGVCLGAQLLAAAAAGEVLPGEVGPEIGWGEIQLTSASQDDALFAGVPPNVTVLHWHGETVALPAGAVRLASSEMYPNQAFRVGSSAWGLQFHLEVDEASVAAFARAFGGEAQAAGVDVEDLMRSAPSAISELLAAQRLVLDRFARLIASDAPGGAVQAQVQVS